MNDEEKLNELLDVAGADGFDDGSGALVIDTEEFNNGAVMMTRSGVEKSRVTIPLILELELEKLVTVVRRLSKLPEGAKIRVVEVSASMTPAIAMRKYGDTLVAYVKRRRKRKGDLLGFTVSENVSSVVQLVLVEPVS